VDRELPMKDEYRSLIGKLVEALTQLLNGASWSSASTNFS